MKTKKACIWILMTVLLVSLLVGCTGGNKEPISTSGGGRTSGKSSDAKTEKTGSGSGKSGKVKMPFNGEVTFHDMNVTIPSSFIRDTTQSSDDIWVFECNNYKSYIMLIHGALEMQGGMTSPEEYCESLQSTGAASEVTSYRGYPCVYTTSVTNTGMYATEAVFFVGDTSYALTMCTTDEDDMAEYQTVYASLSFAGGDLTTDGPDAQSPVEPYKQVLQLFRDALDGKDVTEGIPEDAWLSYEYTSCMYELSYAAELFDETDGGYGYALTDLDGNGVEELLIGRNESASQTASGSGPSSTSVVAVFTLSDGEEIQAIPILFGWARSSYYLTKNNTFAHYGSMGAMDGYAGEWAVDYAAIRQQGTGVRIYTDPESDDAAFYRLRPEADLYAFDEMERISEEEYDAYLERLQADLTTTPLQSIESGYDVPAWAFPVTSSDENEYRFVEGIAEVFCAQYQNDNAGVVSNIWEQSTGIVFSFGIENASFQGDTSYDDEREQLGFYAVDYSTDAAVTGYVEKEGDGIRVTFTGSDSEWISAGDVYTLDRVY